MLASEGTHAETNLLNAPRFVSADGQRLEAWAPWEPSWSNARLQLTPTREGVRMSSPEAPYGVGGLTQTLRGIRGGQAYAVLARVSLQGVSDPSQSTLMRVEWLKEERLLHPAGVLVRGPILAKTDSSDARFEDVLVAPSDANAARVTLEVKWPREGTVLWREASLTPAPMPRPRKVKVGTVYLRPRNSTPAKNLELWCAQVGAAGKLGLDIVCLSEAILLPGTAATHSDIAEPIPGPTTQRLGEVARHNHLWIVAGLMEIEGAHLYNTAVLLDRQGQVAGKYRKVHLPREEWQKGIRPGHEYPVFQTDFGTIAMQVCYDYFFAEPAGLFAAHGAEILFAPTWGTTFADQDGRAEGQTIFRVRARDNGLYVVPSVYDGVSMVIDPLGRVLATSGGQTGVFWAEIDLAQREPLWWVGHWRSIGPRDRMPETYGELTK